MLEFDNYVLIDVFSRAAVFPLQTNSWKLKKPTEWFFGVFEILWVLVHVTTSQLSSCVKLFLGLKPFSNSFVLYNSF